MTWTKWLLFCAWISSHVYLYKWLDTSTDVHPENVFPTLFLGYAFLWFLNMRMSRGRWIYWVFLALVFVNNLIPFGANYTKMAHFQLNDACMAYSIDDDKEFYIAPQSCSMMNPNKEYAVLLIMQPTLLGINRIVRMHLMPPKKDSDYI